MSSIKQFALVDCNNFYASCEQVFNPRLKLKPLLILSNNDGCVIARSQKAKELGAKMGDPAYLYRERAERGEVNMLSSNFALYADMSQRVMQTLESFSSEMEIYSIDEAFFLLEDGPDLAAAAAKMRSKVLQWTGIPVSIGIGPTKTIAKLANKAGKAEKERQGVMVLTDLEKIREHLEKTQLPDIWGIGQATAAKLQKNGIYTAAQLASFDDRRIRKWLGVAGYRTVLELRGISCIPLAEEEEMRKSIVCSRSFQTPIATLEALNAAIAAFVTRAAEKLRGQESLAGFLSVFFATSPFREPYTAKSCHIEIPNPTAYTPALISLAKEGLAKIFIPGLEIKRGGILLGDFSDRGARQLDLFSSEGGTEKKQKAMETVDRINVRYDKAAVRFAAVGFKQAWKSKPSRISPKFTTSWHDLLKVR
jgi:DNA polymerase V